MILKEETHITRVIDPAGGSFYVEQLTDELADQAWKKFLDVDAAGGILEALKKVKFKQKLLKYLIKRTKCCK